MMTSTQPTMRIEFIVDDNPLYVLPFFEEYVRHYEGAFPIARISLCPSMGRRSRFHLFKQLTALYGPLGMVNILTRLVKAKLFGLFPRKRGALRYETLTQLCKAHKIPFSRIGNPNKQEYRIALAQRAPDLLVSVACPYILKTTVLSIPSKGCINIHHAPLPKYRGMMPTFWQLFHQEESVGLTVHYMSDNVDEGIALLQERLTIEPGESLDHLIGRAKRHGAHCMAEVFKRLATGGTTEIKLDNTQASYFTFPTTEQMLEFRRRGLRVL